MAIRVAFAGASGTGKTTLAKLVSKELGLPINPVGSRSVAKEMGYDNPYDVDLVTEEHPNGRRAEFQRRLVTAKCGWEDAHESFITDRTTLDNLAYTMFHDVYAVDQELLASIVAGMQRYTHIVFFPVDVFCNVSDDPRRVGGGEHGTAGDMTYHHLYDLTIRALLEAHRPKSIPMTSLFTDELASRQEWVKRLVNGTEPMTV